MKKKNNKSLFILIFLMISIIIIIIFMIVEAGKKEEILIAKEPLERGTVIMPDETDSYFSVKKLYPEEVPENAVKKTEETKGIVMLVNVDKSDIVKKGDFEIYKNPIEEMTDPVIMGLKANESSQFVSGTIRKGDRINVSVVKSSTDECETLLENAYVTGAYNSDGSETGRDGCAMMINILVEKSEEKNINEKIVNGTVRISKRR